MKRHLLLSVICLLLFAFLANTAFADYIGPNPDLRTYTEYTIQQVSIPGVYVQCVDDTASPARTLGQFCDISGSNTPADNTPPVTVRQNGALSPMLFMFPKKEAMMSITGSIPSSAILMKRDRPMNRSTEALRKLSAM